MVEIVRYLTHPQVNIDPEVEVARWGLTALGLARTTGLANSGALSGTTSVFSSAETKAIETATPLADALKLNVQVQRDMHENNRTATGYLPRAAFEEAADAFFANPQISVRGWERAIDAQSRICRAVEAVLKQAPKGDVLIVGHGAVGTLLWCALSGRDISRIHDQPGGGGNAFAFHRHDRAVQSGWQPFEALQMRSERVISRPV